MAFYSGIHGFRVLAARVGAAGVLERQDSATWGGSGDDLHRRELLPVLVVTQPVPWPPMLPCELDSL